METLFTAIKILGWVLCGMVGLWGLITYTRLSWGIWLRNLRRQEFPQDIRPYLKKAALAVLAMCGAAYGALLVYDWRFLDWYYLFLAFLVIALGMATGNLWWEIYWGRKMSLDRRQAKMTETDRRLEID